MKVIIAASVDEYTDVTCTECKAEVDQPCIGYKQAARVHPQRKAIVHRIWMEQHAALTTKLTKLALI